MNGKTIGCAVCANLFEPVKDGQACCSERCHEVFVERLSGTLEKGDGSQLDALRRLEGRPTLPDLEAVRKELYRDLRRLA